MKNKIFKILILTAFAIIIFGSIQGDVIAAADAATKVAPITMKKAIIKFLIAMGGVALSSLILYFGLSLYNRIRAKKVPNQINKTLSTLPSELETPKTVEDSINLFINKNRL